MYKTNGIDVICDVYGVKVAALNDLLTLEMLVKKAIEISGAEVLSFDYKIFEPQGITLTAILSESSMDVHTYPEFGYAAISIFTCGNKANPIKAIQFLCKVFNPEHINCLKINRGEKKEFTYEVFTLESLKAIK